MTPRRVTKSRDPRVRRKELSASLVVIAMRACTNCKSNPKGCKVGPESDRCLKCVSNGRKCDLVVSPAEIANVEASRKKLWSEIKETQAKLIRLQKLYDKVEERKQQLVERELQNIEELEADEQSAQAVNSFVPDDLLFDVSLE